MGKPKPGNYEACPVMCYWKQWSIWQKEEKARPQEILKNTMTTYLKMTKCIRKQATVTLT
jgi:hypothetical protein